jgi:hypothetical protein
MGSSILEPFVVFAQKRQATLDTTTSIIPTDGLNVLSTLLIVTKYGLRLHIHDGAINISYFQPPQPPTSNTSNAVFTPFSYYRVFPNPFTTFKVRDDEYLNDSHLPYTAWVKSFSEWDDIHNDSFWCQWESGKGDSAFAELDEFVAWLTEGFLLSCWLALQDDVREVDYAPAYYPSYYDGTLLRDTTGRPYEKVYNLRKGQLEKELMQFLMHTEELVSRCFAVPLPVPMDSTT